MGFDIFIVLIQFGLSNPKVIQAATTNSFIQNLNELLLTDELTEELEELFWEKLVQLVEKEPWTGAEFIYKLDLWGTICQRANR